MPRNNSFPTSPLSSSGDKFHGRDLKRNCMTFIPPPKSMKLSIPSASLTLDEISCSISTALLLAPSRSTNKNSNPFQASNFI
jgi:hypothetical protein